MTDPQAHGLTRAQESKGCPSCASVAATWITDCTNPIHMEQANAYIHTLEAEVEGLRRSHREMLEHFTAMRMAAGGYDDTMEGAVKRIDDLRAQLVASVKAHDIAKEYLQACHGIEDNLANAIRENETLSNQLAAQAVRMAELEGK